MVILLDDSQYHFSFLWKEVLFFVAAIAASGDNNVTTYIQKQFSTFNSDLLNLLNWLKSNNCFDVCMESTSKYWIPVFNILESELNIFLTHPKYVKVIRSKKTDKKD